MQLWNQRRLPQLQGDGPAPHRCCSTRRCLRRAPRRRASRHSVLRDQFRARIRSRPSFARSSTTISQAARRSRARIATIDVKFDQLLVTARQIGADRIATGHYARVRHNRDTGRYELLRARRRNQGPVVFSLRPHAGTTRAHRFPLGELTKQEVREIARRLAVPVAEKPESQEICFVPTGNYVRFIESYLQEQGSARARANPAKSSPLPAK